MATNSKTAWIIIVGAGPAGLLLALLLGRKGVSVQLIEKETQVDQRPRASHYSAPAAFEFERAGILTEARERGFIVDTICWQKLDQTHLGGFSQTVFSKDNKDLMVCLPLDGVLKLLLEHVQKLPNVKIVYDQEVVDIGQDTQAAWIDIKSKSAEGPQRMYAEYVVGCDGANSQVRRSLFGTNFPGFTWDQQIVATNTYFPFEKYGFKDGNFIIHPEHWYLAARITKYGLWRITYGEKPGLSHEELVARHQAKLESLLPGNPKPSDNMYKVESISPYRVHQRLAEKMRVGRILLAADAAHLCNPFGGLGLTGGIVDVGGLYDCLMGIYGKRAEDSILDKYDEIRRQKYSSIIDPLSTQNMKRLFEQDPDTAADEDELLAICKKASVDDEFSQHFQGEIKALMHDFTQYYTAGGDGNPKAAL